MITNDDIFDVRHAPPQAIIPENGFYAAARTSETRPALDYKTSASRKSAYNQDDVPPFYVNHAFKTTAFQSETDYASMAPTRTGTYGVCPMCSGYFQRLDRHILTHSDSRPFSCDKCPENFRQKTHLLRHLETHERMELFPCTYCGKVLTRKDKLKQHMSRTCKILREY